MKKLDIRDFNPYILRNATLICNGKGYMRTYNLNNGLIFKEVKGQDDDGLMKYLYHDDFVDCLSKKLSLCGELSDEYLILPKTIYMKDGQVYGYTVPFIDMQSFDSLIKDSKDLDFITDSFILLNNAVKSSNKDGIVFPDLGNASNIFYDPKKKTIKFIDFDGLQIGDCDSFNVSLLMDKYNNPVFKQFKYFDKMTTLFTTNFDKASLMTLLLFYATGTNLTNFESRCDFTGTEGHYSLKKECIDYYLERIGLKGSPLEESIYLIYNNDKNNNYLETPVKRLNKTYRIDEATKTFRKL